jgi:GT2 family glycosyltransferase
MGNAAVFYKSFLHSLIFENYFHRIHKHLVASKVAIVILNYNGRGFLEQFLPSIVASSYAAKEIIVADNASTDDSVIFLQGHYPGVRIIRLPRNLGFAQGYNEALNQVDANYFVLLNSDVQVDAGWLEPMVEMMDSDPEIGACQPKILSFSKRDHFEYAGAAGGWLDCLGYPFARGRIFDVCEQDLGQYDDPQEIFWASGAALMVRARLFKELGGLDGYFFAHMEEIDFCWRLQLAGYSIYVCPTSMVYHVGGGTLPKGNERKVFLNFRNNLIMLAKNLPFGQALWKIPFRLLLDSLSAWKSLLNGEAIYFKAVLEAHFAFAKWLLFRRHRSVFPVRRTGGVHGWFLHSVAWQHFILGKKTFNQIVAKKK